MSQQGLRQASFRAIGSTATDYGGDALAAFAAEATIPAGATFNGAFILWLQERLGSASTNINDLMAEFAAAEGADNAGTVGSFDPSTTPLEEAEALIAALSPIAWWKFDEGTGTAIVNYGSLGAGANLAGAGSGGAWVTGGFDTENTRYFIVGAGATLGISGTAARTVVLVGNPQGLTGQAWGAEWIGDGVITNGTRWTLRNASSAASIRAEIAGEGFTETTLTDLVNGTWAFTASSMAAGGTKLTDCDLYVNAATQACTGTTVTINTAGNFRVGTIGGFGSPVDMIIGHCLVFDTELSAANIAAIRAAVTTIMAARGVTLP